MNKNWVPVWTLFHGDQLRRQESEIEYSGEKCWIKGIGSSQHFWIYIPNKKLLPHTHIFLFHGSFVPFGMSPRVKELPWCWCSDLEQRDFPIVHNDEMLYSATTSKQSASPLNFKGVDTQLFGFSGLRRLSHENGRLTHQSMYTLALAIPRGDERMVILMFRERSLQPIYRMVRSLPKEVIVETASGY